MAGGADDFDPSAAERLVLRLPDVGRGYLIGDDSGCGGLGTENAPPSIAQLAIQYYPVPGCSMEFERLWRARGTPARGAPFVESDVLVFRAPDGAAAALRVAADLARYVLLWQPAVAPSAERVVLGDETVAFAGGRNFVLVWRKGGVVSLLHVRGRSAADARAVAVALARRQEQRIEKPTPVPPRANDDREVRLDNPRLGIEVYWLGLRFAPRHRLPPVRLAYVFGPEREDELGYRASIDYEGKRDVVTLDLWKRGRWDRFQRTKTAQRFWGRACVRRRVVPVRHGYAELLRSCPRRRGPSYVANVYLPRVVTRIRPACTRCARGEGSYGSFKGLTAMARALRPRRYSAASTSCAARSPERTAPSM